VDGGEALIGFPRLRPPLPRLMQKHANDSSFLEWYWEAPATGMAMAAEATSETTAKRAALDPEITSFAPPPPSPSSLRAAALGRTAVGPEDDRLRVERLLVAFEAVLRRRRAARLPRPRSGVEARAAILRACACIDERAEYAADRGSAGAWAAALEVARGSP
jgi:hypothetical protein